MNIKYVELTIAFSIKMLIINIIYSEEHKNR